MKIKYKFVDGTIVTVDVDNELRKVLKKDRNDEHALVERNRYHRAYAIDALKHEGLGIAVLQTPETEMVYEEEDTAFWQQFYATWDNLTETQKRRITLYADGMNLEEIAKAEGVAIKSVHETITQVRKKFSNSCILPPSKMPDFSVYSERRRKLRNYPLRKGERKNEASTLDQCGQGDCAEQRDHLPDTEDQGAHPAVPAGTDLSGNNPGSR